MPVYPFCGNDYATFLSRISMLISAWIYYSGRRNHFRKLSRLSAKGHFCGDLRPSGINKYIYIYIYIHIHIIHIYIYIYIYTPPAAESGRRGPGPSSRPGCLHPVSITRCKLIAICNSNSNRNSNRNRGAPLQHAAPSITILFIWLLLFVLLYYYYVMIIIIIIIICCYYYVLLLLVLLHPVSITRPL